MRLDDNELMSINGGGISASLLNAISRTVTTMLGLGQIIGSAIRRLMAKNSC